MKRIISLLLIVCSSLTAFADSSADQPKRPEKVIANLNTIINLHGHKAGQSFAINRNPNTNIIESSEKIATFSCFTYDASFETIAESFMADEPLCYQILHMVPGNKEVFKLKVVTNEGSKTIVLRSKKEQEMWLMCTKNPENPQLRDAYAIVWEEMGADDVNFEVEGTVYMITSLRPDIYEKSAESNKRMFKIEGRVDANIADSLYNIYIADTRDALYALDDDDYVACVPVVNKRFEFQTELDHPMVGRLRCIFPDGSLCSAWIDLDFVPGETYRITTHNGYYDEDRDYEQRVGRYSGKSLLNDLQRRGIDDQTVTVVDEVPEEFRVVETTPSKPWRQTLQPHQLAQLKLKAELVKMDMENIKLKYQAIGEAMGGFRSHDRIMLLFDQILEKNKELDKKYQEVIKQAKKMGIPAEEMPGLYKEILQFYTEQNKALNDAFKDSITHGKATRKLQEYVTKQTEKYIKEMEKSLQ